MFVAFIQDLACDVDMNKIFTNMTSGMIILSKTSAIKGASVTLSSIHYKTTSCIASFDLRNSEILVVLVSLTALRQLFSKIF